MSELSPNSPPFSKKRTHLAIIRSIVERMGWASWLIRVWTLAVVGALVAVATIPEYTRFGWLALALALGFWIFDAYLLRQRRLYKKAYSMVAQLDEADVDFSLDTTPVDNDEDSWVSTMFNRYLAAYHLVVATGVGVSIVL